MVPAFTPSSCPQLAVPLEVMQHVAQVESSGNRFAIGVVGGRLERQPRNLGEAVATARMLESKGYDYSLGIAQINRSNLVRYGLDTFEKAFDGCANVTAGARILAECYSRSGADWGKAFSCYYSGNFVTGYRDGYVQRMVASFGADALDAEAIAVHSQATERPGGTSTTRPAKYRIPTDRVSIRSVAIDTTADALVSAVAGGNAEGQPAARTAAPAPVEPAGTAQRAFVPRVHGPGGSPGTEPRPPVSPTRGPVASKQGEADAAFVF